MRLLEFVIILLIGACLAVAVRDDLQQRDALTLARAANAAQGGARVGETAAASRSQAGCVAEGKAGLRAGLAIARAAAIDPTPRAMISAQELGDVAAP